MYQKKPIPAADEHTKRICPVCGKQSYSAGGIHPQCAVQQADEPRKQELKAIKEAAQKKPTAAKKQTQPWLKKKCPKCGVEIHVRQEACSCGFDFSKC